MKYILRTFLFDSFSLWLVSQIFPAMTISGGWQGILVAGGILTLLMVLIAPMLRILFIPVNMLTFGLLSWFVNVIVIYLLTLAVPGVFIRAWTFPGASYEGFVIPAIFFSYPVALIVSSLAITFLSNIMHAIAE